MSNIDYNGKTYEELLREERKLETEYGNIEEQCLKDNLSFTEFCEKAHDVKENLFFVDKYIRLKKEPIITYGKEWNGKFMTFDEFKSKCESKFYNDEDGIAYYATETSKTDIEIKPSDFDFNLVRTEFPYIIWFDINK
jgi:hypothetical protein